MPIQIYRNYIRPLYDDVKTFVLDTLFPIECLSCGKEGEFICDECKELLTKTEHQYCIACQKPSVMGFTHEGCKAPQTADGCAAFFDYHDSIVSKVIITGKYSFVPAIYKRLGIMVAEKIKSTGYQNLWQNFCLVPIPLAKSRQRWRGFNQAEILCQTIGKELGWPVMDVLIRKKITKTQKDLKKEERSKNVESAFGLNPKSEIKDLKLLLVDDVTTTGSTLSEAVKVLKRNGVASVWCLTVAKD